MKKIETPRTVYDVTYEARDGKVFESKERCKNHEELLDFNEFKLDKSKLKGELTADNWKHYMYEFLQLFAYRPSDEAQLLQEYSFEKRTYEKNKEKNHGFDLNKVREYFAEEFYHVQSYEEEYGRNNWNNGNGPRPGVKRLYKKDIDYIALYKFMFETELLKLEDVCTWFKHRVREDDEGGLKAKSYFYGQVFYTCFYKNSTEMMDIAIKYLKLDLVPFLTDKSCNSFGGGSRNVRLDFLSALAVGNSDRYGKIGSLDDFKRVKWVEYFLSKDLPVQLFRFSTTTSVICSDGKRGWTGVKEGQEKIINYPISELVNEIKSLKNCKEIYLFKKWNERVANLFEEKCGPNFTKANKNNKLPEYYELALRACEIFKEIYSEHQEIQIIEDDSNLFEFSRVISENMSIKAKKSHDNREAKEIAFEFKLGVLNEDHQGTEDVCVIYMEEKNSYYSRDKNSKTTKKIIDLKEYSGKPDKLAMELAYELNLGSPLGLTASEKVSEIDAKLFEIEKRKEAIKKEEEALTELKKETSVNMKGKK